jgi:hypothetical protein
MWSGFALWAATVWDRVPTKIRIVSAVVIGGCGLLLGLLALGSGGSTPGAGRKTGIGADFSAWHVLQQVPPAFWHGFWPLAVIVSASLIIFAAISAHLTLRGRERMAAVAIGIGMVPAGLAMIDGVARMAPYFSLAEAARFLDARPGPKGQVVYEGALHQGSSLVFYLHQSFYLVNCPQDDDSFVGADPHEIVLDENVVLRKWGEPDLIYLIVNQSRVPHWQRLITDKFHIFHQVMTSGSCVVLSNEL